MTNKYIKSMAIGDKLNKNKELNIRTQEWYASEHCRAFTKIMVNAVDFAIGEINIDELMKEVVIAINEVNIGTYDEYARGFIAGEKLGEPNENNIKKAKICEEIWESEENKYGYYQEVVNEVIKNG